MLPSAMDRDVGLPNTTKQKKAKKSSGLIPVQMKFLLSIKIASLLDCDKFAIERFGAIGVVTICSLFDFCLLGLCAELEQFKDGWQNS